MTFSIVARCPTTGQLGVAAVTAVPAVGKLLTWAAPRAGAVATQAHINPYLGFDALPLLRAGRDADETLREVLGADPHRDLRQLAIVDGVGRVAVHTGEAATDWKGHRVGEAFVVCGNYLVGPSTVDAMFDAFATASGELAERLVVALEAGVRAGGDRRGCSSATVYVVDQEEYPLWDVRVDDHASPLRELRRLYGVFRDHVVPEIRKMPKRGEAGGAGEGSDLA